MLAKNNSMAVFVFLSEVTAKLFQKTKMFRDSSFARNKFRVIVRLMLDNFLLQLVLVFFLANSSDLE